jgi:beta-lactamase superfamily II metal-dependent hydrolase
MRRLVLLLIAAAVMVGCNFPPDRAWPSKSAAVPRSAKSVSTTADGVLTLWFFSVGQGDCTLIQCPHGGTILVDCGSIGGADHKQVKTSLREHLDQVHPKVDTLVITHPDADHYNLLPEVLDGVEVGKVLVAGKDAEFTAASFDAWLASHHDAVTRLHADDFDPSDRPPQFCDCGDAEARVLAADTPEADAPATESSTNARSIVLSIRFGLFGALLAGDGTFATEETILGRFEREWLGSDVLKVGHHGSATTSTSQEWAAAVRPEVAIISAGYENRFGHPNKDVVERLAAFAKPVSAHPFRWGWREGRSPRFEDLPAFEKAIYSTATNGTIHVSTAGRGYQLTLEQP